MKTLGTISLLTESDIVSFRNKMFEVVALLSKEDIYASKVAASISSFCKFYLQFSEAKITAQIESTSSSLGAIILDFGLNPEGFCIDNVSQTLLFGIGRMSEKDNALEIKYQHLYNFDFLAQAEEIFNIKTVEELMHNIKAKNNELESSLSNLKKAKDLNARMEGELEVGQNIQMSMLPNNSYSNEHLDIYAELIPAREVGGDFYDFFFIDEDHICFVVGDVSGKGVPAALMMAVTKTLLKSRAGNDTSTASILTHVNNEIAKDNDTYMFITVFMAILDTNSGKFVYSNAGHNPSFVIDKEKKEIEKLGNLHGPVIGAMEGMTYGETQVSLKKNDIVIAYTDGVTESHNIKEELYSDAKFERLLKAGDYESPEKLTNLIIDSVKIFEEGAEQFDDITVLAVQFKEDPNTIENQGISFEIKSNLVEIISTIEQFETFGMEYKIPNSIIQKINIVLDEMLSNIISYGYNDEIEHIIKIDIELKGKRMIITLTDDGIPFNPFKNGPPDTMLSVEERGIGGLGIHIVENLMDEYEYKRNTNRNIITLVIYNINTK